MSDGTIRPVQPPAAPAVLVPDPDARVDHEPIEGDEDEDEDQDQDRD